MRWTLALWAGCALAAAAAAPAVAGEVDAGLAAILEQRSAGETVSVLVFLNEQADIPALDRELRSQRASRATRNQRVVTALRDTAERTQGNFREYLKNLELAGRIRSFQSFYVANMFRVETTPAEVAILATHPDVLRVYYNYEIESDKPVQTGPNTSEQQPQQEGGQRVIATGVVAVRAPEVWALGFRGEGILVATLDTGVDGNHPALHDKWRGLADPRYQGHPTWAWFDPVTNTTFPQSFGSHGTHTMGTVCGESATHQIGVAPGAQWIHAAVIDRVSIPQTVADALSAFEWMLDPNEDPTTSWDVPQVCSNSWRLASVHGYPPCDQTFWVALDNCEAAGIIILFSAGNEGPSPSTIGRPPDRATDPYMCFAVGALDANTTGWPIADFSSRGPSNCTPNGQPTFKPEVAAPGVNVLSSVPGGGYESDGWSGTSMASPHVNGACALILQACPDLTVQEVKQILFDTAVDLGTPGEDNAYGMGMIDVYEAVQIALSLCSGAPRARDVNIQTPVDTAALITLDATDYDGLPDPPGALTFIVTTLPANATLADAGNGHVITAGELPYSLVGYGNQVVYTPNASYYGTDTFNFKANDGGVPPDGGDSNEAIVSVLVLYGPPTITTDSLPPGLINGVYGPVQLEVDQGQPPLTWTVLAEGQYFEENLGSSQFASVGTAQNWRADDNFWTYSLPFAFPYFGQTYTTAYVCSNGFINFGSGSSEYSNSDSALINAKRIAAMFDDLRTDGTGEDIFVDASVAGQVTFRWKGRTYSGSYPCNFSIVLYEDGRIRFHYGSGNTNLTATIGVSNGDGTHYLLSSYNNAPTLTNANSLEFFSPPSLPDGVTLSASGVLSGIPGEVGIFQPIFRVTDSLNRTDQRMLTLEINSGPVPPIAQGQNLTVAPGVPVSITLVATDDGLPDPPGALTYIVTSLPAHGGLVEPGVGPITSVPWTLAGGGNVVEYAPSVYYIGPDSFQFKANDGGVPPEGGDSLPATVSTNAVASPEGVLSFTLDTNPGWSTTGAWAYGQPTGGGSHARDPNSGHTGLYVYGYNLAGDYTNNMPARYLTTGPLNFKQVSSVSMSFWRRLGVEASDQAAVQASNDNLTWTTLWSNGGVGYNEAGWTQQTLNLAAVADRQPAVYVRWVMGPTDVSVTYPGWNIDDIEFSGIVHPVIPGDLNCDGQVDFGDINPFVQALTDPAGWQSQYPDCPVENGDINGDGSVEFGDINPFVLLLTNP